MKETFIPIQIDQERCTKCKRCYNACKNDAIYFEQSLRFVDYSKCKGCLDCQRVCPRNLIQVTYVVPNEVANVKIDYDKCTMCGLCTDMDGAICPNHLFEVGKVMRDGKKVEGVVYKHSEISKCQGCEKCELNCPEGAIKVIKYNPDEVK
ncbi:MAG: 4Fe-4S binding protein [Promethearchaeia archaeon]